MLLLFDIDGTLLLTRGAGVRAMVRAGQEMWGEGFTLQGITISGGMDPWIVDQAVRRLGHSLSAEALDEFKELYDTRLSEELEAPTSEATILPGVMDLLNAVRQRHHLTLGLLTGNFERSGERKLEHVEIDPSWFRIRVFGDHAPTRPELVRLAMERHGERDPERVIIIGDTPRDVQCAHQNGCRVIAVCTGVYEHTELQDTGANLVLPDLTHTDAFWSMLSRA